MKITSTEKKRRRIRWQQGASQAADDAHKQEGRIQHPTEALHAQNAVG